jgi:predicted nucleotidyltransferase
MSTAQVLKKCKRLLAAHYGDAFKGLFLYGSLACRTSTKDSDIDLLVVLSGLKNYGAELKNLSCLLYDAQLDSTRLLSAKPVDKTAFDRGALLLYRNAKKQGRFL